MNKKISCLLIFILSLQRVFASHTAGGVITHKYVSKAANEDITYTIKLTLFLDCKNGSPSSIAMDSLAWLNVFDAKTGDKLSGLAKEVRGQTPVRVKTNSYNCIQNSPDVCVDMYVYETNIVLPKRANGYIISFERCCRNNLIANINNPYNTGSTYWTEIKPESSIGKNSSPVFKSQIPAFLCVSAPFAFNHSATDDDGDSLVYELFTPYLGGSSANPRPDGSRSIFPLDANRLITWLYPYGVSNVMGGNPQLQINKTTGQLTITPDQAGMYAAGIKVNEYRKGVLLGETRLDYMFNVSNCTFNILASFNVYDLTFINIPVTFANQSMGALKYHWDFGDPSTNSDTSSAKSPAYTYNKPGTYKVTLVATNSTCSDTSSINIFVKKCLSMAEFSTNDVCSGQNAVFINKSKDTTNCLWLFGDGQSTKEVSPKHKFPIGATKKYNVALIINDKNGCYDSIVYPITIYQYPISDFWVNKTDSSVFLEAMELGHLQYKWKYGNTDSAITSNGNFTFILTKPEQLKVCLQVTNIGNCASQTCNANIGIPKVVNPYGFKLFPNPNPGCFTIEFGNGKSEKAIEIFNQLGQIVYSEKFKESRHKFEPGLQNGIYLLKIITREGHFIQRLIVEK